MLLTTAVPARRLAQRASAASGQRAAGASACTVRPRRAAPARALALAGGLPELHHAPALLAQLADAAADAAAAVPPLSEEAAAALKAAEQLAANKSGFLGGIANVLESALEGIDGVLAAAHVPYSYGFSIIVLTLFVKALTFPLSKKQIESTTAMQALQPRVKDLQVRRRAGEKQPSALLWWRHLFRPEFCRTQSAGLR